MISHQLGNKISITIEQISLGVISLNVYLPCCKVIKITKSNIKVLTRLYCTATIVESLSDLKYQELGY